MLSTAALNESPKRKTFQGVPREHGKLIFGNRMQWLVGGAAMFVAGKLGFIVT